MFLKDAGWYGGDAGGIDPDSADEYGPTYPGPEPDSHS